ncbi:MAG TPA: polysaccharide deacetylase family protein [Verrucomicrobiae bacterium]|nr:polysaccharide deacetylase family protein [Verrucomicrobiae bacterium]
MIQTLRASLRDWGYRLIGPVGHFVTSGSEVALTFDDGPHAEYTPRLLAILERHNVRATFFMVGQKAAQYPELVRRVAEAGHAVTNHSWDHPAFPEISGPQRRHQIRACGGALAPYGQRFFRPPYGSANLATLLDALFLRYELIGWNLDVDDWVVQDPGWMADRLIHHCRPGSIILLHDAVIPATDDRDGTKIHRDRAAMLQALSLFLDQKGRDFRFVTIPEVFRLRCPVHRG